MLLERLCNAISPTGFEGEVRNIIKNYIKDYVDEITIDNMGNIITHKKGSGPKILIDAHMDEVGFIITGFNNDGTLKFSPLGGINPKVVLSKVVYVGEKKIPAVIGFKPIHLQSKDERISVPKYKDLALDIGVYSKEEAKKYVSLGDFAVFDTKYGILGENFIKGKAFDDRIGCGVLIEILKENYNCDLYGVFNVQEEIGDRGAYVSSYKIKPDIGIAIEGTICADLPKVDKTLVATELGRGPAISIMDRTSIFNYDLCEELINLAEKNKISYQRRKAIAGGNDAGAIHMSGDGAVIATISVPCRYIHSSLSVASLEDYKNTIDLLKRYLKSF